MTQASRFNGLVAIVTGAAGGIGRATAVRLASEGATLVLSDIRQEQVDAVAAELRHSGAPEHWATVCNVSREEEVKATVAETMKRFGRLDVVVNNAATMVFKPLEEHTEEDWMKVLHVNLMGPFYFTKQAFLHMKPGGTIVNVASIHAEVTSPMICSYAASKAGLASLTRSAAIEGKDKGIRINAVLPGAVDTPMFRESPNVKSGAEKFDPAFIGKPEEIAAAIAFLASAESSFVQGANLRIDGGKLIRV